MELMDTAAAAGRADEIQMGQREAPHTRKRK